MSGTVRRAPLRVALPCFVALAASASAQQERFVARGLNRIERFGKSVALLGDVNQDGVPDWAVGAPVVEDTGKQTGFVRVYSGATGVSLREFTLGDSSGFGSSLASAGDWNGDGRDDLLVGAPDANSSAGEAVVVSGLDGSVLLTLTGGSPLARYGSTVATIGDVDGDGARDFVIGGPDHQSKVPWGYGIVELKSGHTGALLRSWVGPSASAKFGARVASVGDFDGDGKDDLLVAGPTQALFGLYGTAVAFGSTTANELFTHVDTNGGFGKAICSVGDLDGDGLAEFAASRPSSRGGITEIFAASDRSVLHSFTQNGFDAGFALAGGRDLDGDGFGELLIGAPPFASDDQVSGGKAQLRSPAAGKLLKEKSGRDDRRMFHAGACFFDDLDGDGIAELLAGVSTTPSPIDTLEIAVLAGSDGHEIKRFTSTGNPFGGPIVLAPDLNGDGVSEFVVTSAQSLGFIEVHSGSDGALLRTFTDARVNVGFGASLAVGVQPSGAVHLCIGIPLSSALKATAGEVLVVDLATGATVAQAFGNLATEAYGTSVAYAGDVNKDGTGDWFVGAPFNDKNATDAGRAVAISGKTGAQLKAILGAVAGEHVGAAVARLGDIDADAVNDLAIGVPFAGANGEGEVRIYSMKSITLVRSIVGAVSSANFGASLAATADANGDGIADLAGGYASRDRIDLVSTANGALLRTITPASPPAPTAAPAQLLTTPGWLAAKNGGGDGPLLALHAPEDTEGGIAAGSLSLFELDDLYLTISPSSAPAGIRVSANTRGGPAGAAALLMLEAIDGAPVGIVLATATLGTDGSWSVSDVIPPGLAGQVWTLRSYAVGFGGKLVDTQAEELLFE